MTTVEQLMKTNLVTAHAQTSVRDAVQTMAEAEIRHLPVVNEGGKLIGMVSQRDAMSAFNVMRATGGERTTTRVGDIMTTSVIRVTRKMAAHQAAAMMIETKIGALPVVANDGQLVGIVTETDFLEVAREALLGMSPVPRARA